MTTKDTTNTSPVIDAVEVVTTILAGSKLKVSAAKLKPFLDFHGLSTSKEALTVEVLRMGMGTTDISKKFEPIVVEIKLIENDDETLDDKVMNVAFRDLVTITPGDVVMVKP
jgi:hypothetical protein